MIGLHVNEDRLEKYKQQLLNMNQRLGADIREMTSEITAAGVIVGEHSSHTRDSLEAEIVLEKNEEAMQRDVQTALRRLESGTFGTCEDCGSQILKARLDAIPYTPICIDCELQREST